MKDKQYQEIKEHVPSIDKYQKEIEKIENFFIENQLNIESTPVIFWNHIITLFERIDANEQNDMALDSMESMTEEAQKLTNGFINHLNLMVSDFERYLLTIYFEQIKKEKGKYDE